MQLLTFSLFSPMEPADPHPLIQAVILILFSIAFAAVLFGYCH